MKTTPKITYTVSSRALSGVREKGLVQVRSSIEKEAEEVSFDGTAKVLTLKRAPSDTGRRKLILLLRRAVAMARGQKARSFALSYAEFAAIEEGIDPYVWGKIAATNFGMANFEFRTYRTGNLENMLPFIERIVITDAPAGVEKGLLHGALVSEEVNASRILANTPGSDMTPRLLADAARAAAKGVPLKVEVFDEKKITALKMGGLLGVSKGSAERPQFIVLSYTGGKKGEKPIVLVGKGITFDTGGIHLKPAGGFLEDMHMDMSGGAAVIHAVRLAARRKIKKNIVGLVPAAENMPSGSSYRPGDILHMMSGKTVEVMNTDAEGRIILADALTYAERYKPALVIDVATLTGAAMVALGLRASAIFSRDEALVQKLRDAGERSGDHVWPLPLWDEYDTELQGRFADLANIGKAPFGGAILGATFLKQFTGNYPWAHIDIAPRMTATDDEFLAKGSAGAPIRLLDELFDVL